MQDQPFEVGDIIQWHYPPIPDYCLSWAKEYGPGPFEVIDVHFGGLFIRPLDGKPTTNLSARRAAFNDEIFRTDAFLTAVRRAHAKSRA